MFRFDYQVEIFSLNLWVFFTQTLCHFNIRDERYECLSITFKRNKRIFLVSFENSVNQIPPWFHYKIHLIGFVIISTTVPFELQSTRETLTNSVNHIMKYYFLLFIATSCSLIIFMLKNTFWIIKNRVEQNQRLSNFDSVPLFKD